MDEQLDERQIIGAGWIIVEEEDWSGVNECGAVFVPDREMKFEIDDEEWPVRGSC